ncbi:MAG TPA: pseudouridine synthase [Candidatus Omnitrophota bacterium]|nr:pseudouridine synthase [Candidatus Omnitrophota bacterium]HSA30275.1 pseudouridine synthase [Candidatus Omnitrophota bacterium]
MKESSERLQVFISHSGFCSRRKAMDLIRSGMVTVNGKTVFEPSFPIVADRDRVCAGGRTVRVQRHEYVMLHKPAGFVTSRADQFAKRIVTDLLPPSLKGLNPVGRLDKDTEGLLLLTNDGDFLYALTHPKFDVGKRYEVWVEGALTEQDAKKLCAGISLDGRKTSPAQLSRRSVKSGKTRFELLIHEGRKRQIRRMCESLGRKVVYLKRIQHGPLRLGGLARGKWRHLSLEEVKQLKEGVKINA